MRQLGYRPMPWQVQVLAVALEIDDDGELVYDEVGEIVPRQAGKTSINLATQVHRALKMQRRLRVAQRTLYLAQKQLDARNKLLEEHWPVIEASPFGRFATPNKSTGNEGIKWSNGSYHHVVAPTAKAGHGGSIDLVQVDEAFIHTDTSIEEGVKPTQITRLSPQMWVTSAAGTLKSGYLRGKRDLGREHVRHGLQEGFCYFEWSAPEDSDPSDPAVWEATHPAVGHTIRLKTLAKHHGSMGQAEFARAYLGIWPTKTRPMVIPAEEWERCRDAASEARDPICFAVDVTPDRSMAAVSAAGARLDGATHVEVVRHDAGTGWVVEFCQKLLAKNPGSSVSVDSVGAAGSLLPDLQRKRVPVRLLTTPEVGRSAGLLIDKIKQQGLFHRDQVPLNVALAGASKRKIGDKWGWGRDDGVDISPLVSVTLAVWALETAPAARKFNMGSIV